MMISGNVFVPSAKLPSGWRNNAHQFPGKQQNNLCSHRSMRNSSTGGQLVRHGL